MKKLFVWILVLGLAGLLSGTAFSQTVGLEAHGLYAFSFNGDLNSDSIEPKDSFGLGGTIVLSLADYLKIDLGIDYLKADLKSSDISGGNSGDIELLPLTVGVRLGQSFDFAFLYVGGGIGRSFNDASGDGGWLDLKDCMIYYACLGGEIGLTDNLVLRPELRYNWLRPELEVGLFDDWKEDWKLDHFQARLGLGWYF